MELLILKDWLKISKLEIQDEILCRHLRRFGGAKIRDAGSQHIAGIIVKLHISKIIVIGKLAAGFRNKGCFKFAVGFSHGSHHL